MTSLFVGYSHGFTVVNSPTNFFHLASVITFPSLMDLFISISILNRVSMSSLKNNSLVSPSKMDATYGKFIMWSKEIDHSFKKV